MKKIFALFGTIALDGIQTVNKQLSTLDNDLKNISKELNKTGRNLTKLGNDMTKTFTAPIVAAGASIAVFSSKIGEHADKLLDLQESTRLSTDTLQEFEHVMKMTGGDFNALTSLIPKFTNKIPEIIKGTGASAEAFAMLNVNLKDSSGNIRDMNELFPDMLYALQSIEDPVMRNAIAQDLFGKSLDEIAPLIGESKQQIEAYRKEAHELNAVMSKESIEAADKWRKSIAQLKEQFSILGRDLVMGFIPVLQNTIYPMIKNDLVPVLKDFAEMVKSVADWFNGLDPAVKETVIRLTAILAIAGPLLIAFGSVAKAAAGLRGTMILLNATMLANPFMAVATAIAAVTTAVWLLNKAENDGLPAHKKMGDALEYNLALSAALAEARKKDPFLDTGAFSRAFSDRWKLYNADGNNSMQMMQQSKQAYEETEKAAKKTNTVIKALTEEQKAEIEAYETSQQERIDSLVKSKMESYRKEKDDRLDLQVETNLELLEEQRRLSNEELEIEKELSDAKQALADYDAQVKIEKQREVIDYTINTTRQLFDIFSGFTTNSEIANDNRYKKDKKNIENSVMTEEQKAAAIEKLDAEYEKKKNALRRRQAIIDKAQAMFDIAINTAVAVSKTLWNPVLAGFVAAAGIAQEIAVAARPIPEAEQGAYLPGSENGTIIRAGEKKKPEIILPLKTGVDILASTLASKLSDMSKTMGFSVQQGESSVVENHFHLFSGGTYVGNQASLRDLERMLQSVRIGEMTRMGAIA